jgi:5-methylcytosine-specific restriction protein A
LTLKPCIQCGEPSEQSRCHDHRPKAAAQPSAHQRGYDYRWTQLSKRARRMQDFCTDCGSTDDLTVDHSPEAWAAKAAGKTIKLSMLQVLCRSCNSRKGAAR